MSVATAPRGVLTADAGFAVAIAELPLRARASLDAAGSIVVVGGAGWREGFRHASDDGASAVVIADPAMPDAPPSSDESERDTSAAPVVVARPRLRADVAGDATTDGIAVRLVQVECGGSTARLPGTLRDAIGWARVLAGGPLELVASRASERALSVLLERAPREAGDQPLTVTVLASRREEPQPWIRALAIGAERVEVTVDDATGAAVVRRATRAGQLKLPPRWESPSRVALRRALDALDTGAASTDLVELDHDSQLALRALAAPRPE